MKRWITLSLLLAAVLPATAQSRKIEEARRVLGAGSEDGRVYDDRDDRNSNTTVYGNREADERRINREYDQKVRSIENNRNLSRAEKDRIIRDLNSQRQAELRRLNGDNRRYERDRRDDRSYERDRRYNPRGKEKGWSKNDKRRSKDKNRDRRDRDDDRWDD